jgi:hypothetical protein
MKTYTIIEKRHIKQMNRKERDYLDNVIRPIIIKDCNEDLPKLSNHSLQRFKKKFPVPLTKEDIIDTLSTGDFIEYKKHYTNNVLSDKRVVLRKNMKNDSEYDLVLVYSLMSNEIITVWDNKNIDNHYSLDLTKYSRRTIV